MKKNKIIQNSKTIFEIRCKFIYKYFSFIRVVKINQIKTN